jgi:hypothetical protein
VGSGVFYAARADSYVISVGSVPRLYNADKLPSETAVRRLGIWCEMAASLRGREPGSRKRPLLEDVTKKGSEDHD